MAEYTPNTVPILAIIGATSVGKTALSIAVAERIGAEIISADSRQIYRQLNIGTAKPTASELARVPHHFINEMDIGESFSAGQFATVAADRIEDIIARGQRPLVTGGSTLYIEALLHGLSDIPKTSEESRAHLMARLKDEGSSVLYDELKSIDPKSATTMDASKTQRVVRALEVHRDTGRPLSWYHAHRPTPRFKFVSIVLNRPRKALYERINRRVDYMLEAGLVEENRALINRAKDELYSPLKTIGYREPMAYLKGNIDYSTMKQLVMQNTRRYAKRQITWFRRHPEYIWVNMPGEERADIVVESILKELNG